MHPDSILVVEDDSSIRTVVGLALKAAGFTEVRFAGAGDEGLESAEADPPRLVLLDLMLPGLPGLEVCRRLRANPSTCKIPIVMLTALDDERDIVKGLSAGADDYVTKPFSPSVLVARIKAVLRRSDGQATEKLTLGPLTIDPGSHSATLDGAEIQLTPTEYGILQLLASHPGRVYTRAQIIDSVQGCGKVVTERAVDVQLVGLRRKLGAWAEHIESVRSVGYRLNAQRRTV